MRETRANFVVQQTDIEKAAIDETSRGNRVNSQQNANH
jgi:hypothetical protein